MSELRSKDPFAELKRRARRLRAAARRRHWEYHQRDLAGGCWYRLRRALTYAREIYLISAAEAAELLAEGWPVEPVGAELVPAKTMVVVPAQRVARLAEARQIPVRLSAELLAAPRLALVRFELD